MDLSGELGRGWALTEFTGKEHETGRFQLRLDGKILGVVQRRRSLTGRSTSGWEATRSGMPVTTGTAWKSRGLAAAAIADEHQRLQAHRKAHRRSSPRPQ